MRVGELIEALRKHDRRRVVMLEMATGHNTYTRPVIKLRESGHVLTLQDYDENNHDKDTNKPTIILAKS